jgi:hypothetical protein
MYKCSRPTDSERGEKSRDLLPWRGNPRTEKPTIRDARTEKQELAQRTAALYVILQ